MVYTFRGAKQNFFQGHSIDIFPLGWASRTKKIFTVIDNIFEFAWGRGVKPNTSDSKIAFGEYYRKAKFGSIKGRNFWQLNLSKIEMGWR